MIAGRWIETWEPEDETSWRERGERVARRDLWFSVLSEHIGFSVWTLWSLMVLFMGPEYGVDPAGRFFLISTATLAGALVRVPYTFAVARFGGALGGLAVNLACRQSFQTSGTGTAAFWSFLAFYAVCSALTWVVYLRRPAPVPTKAQVGYAKVWRGGLPGHGRRNGREMRGNRACHGPLAVSGLRTSRSSRTTRAGNTPCRTTTPRTAPSRASRSE